MHSLILLSLYINNLLKHKNCAVKNRTGDIGGAEGAMAHRFFCSKKKKGNKRQKKKSFKGETIKRLSPWSKCYYFSHSRTSRIQKFFLSANHGGRQYFSAFHGPSTMKSSSPALENIITKRFGVH